MTSSSSKIKILVCTANMGNAQPTADSMKCWVPEGGACNLVTPLNSSSKLGEGGTFDVIAIGMQEATWKMTKDMRKSLSAGSSSTGTKTANSSNDKSDDEEDETEYFDEDDAEELAMAEAIKKAKANDANLMDNSSRRSSQQQDMDSSRRSSQQNDMDSSRRSQPDMDSSRRSQSSARSSTRGWKPLNILRGAAVMGGKLGTAAAKSAQKAAQDTSKVAAKTTMAAAKTGKAVAMSTHKVVHDTGKAAAATTKAMALSTQKAVQETTEALLKKPDSDFLRQLLAETLGEDKYHLLKEYQRGQMRLYLYVKKPLVAEISGLDLKAENTGIGNVLANKGGIVCTFTIRKTRISFLTAHLAAHEGENFYKARNDNLRDILRGTKGMGPKHLSGLDAALMSHHMFVMGDLNYRTRLPFRVQDMDENAETTPLEHKVETVLNIVRDRNWSKLYSYDELSTGIKSKHVLVQFETLPCNFNPTFKMLRKDGFQYKTQRVPSYTDRVLYTSAPGLGGNLTPLAYEPCPGFITSDHKPIRGAYSITTTSNSNDGNATSASSSTKNNNNTSSNKKTKTQPLSIVFKDMRCTGLPPADVDGLADPYIMFICDPVSIVEDNRPQKDKKEKTGFNGMKWPVTAWRKKNLNPDWPEEVRLCIRDTNATDLEGAMLYLAVWDFDIGTDDDLMCTMVLNLKDLATFDNGKEEKLIKIDQPLLKYGLEQGHIEGTIVVRRGKILNSSEARGKVKSKLGLLATVGKMFSSTRLKGKK